MCACNKDNRPRRNSSPVSAGSESTTLPMSVSSSTCTLSSVHFFCLSYLIDALQNHYRISLKGWLDLQSSDLYTEMFGKVQALQCQLPFWSSVFKEWTCFFSAHLWRSSSVESLLDQKVACSTSDVLNFESCVCMQCNLTIPSWPSLYCMPMLKSILKTKLIHSYGQIKPI